MERIHLLDRQDLRNIKRQFNLTPQYHKNDVTSVELFVKHLQMLGDDCPVLYYKKQGVECETHCFDKDDFVLVLMTSFQQSVAKRFASKKVCVDSTHGTTGYDFLLTTLLTVDEYGEGVPLAFLISSKTNTATLSFFFQLLKQKVGCIESEVFMSDDAPEFFNAWSHVMVPPKHQLLCVWHVDRNWRTNISQKIRGDQEVKASVYKQLRCLMESKETDNFNELLLQVVNNLLNNDSTREFGKYFAEHYSKRPKLWAFCYRKGLGINTNMFLESMHKVLKHIYLEGKKSKRVDKCINALMTLVRDHMFKRMKKTIKGKCSYRINMIHKSHMKSKEIDLAQITEISNLSWKIESSEHNEYFIQKENTICPDNCKLICSYCKICVHMYTCTCLDNYIKGNLCKHIHAVLCKFGSGSVPDTIPQDETTNEEDELQMFAVQQSQLRDKDENLRIKLKLDMLYKCVSENTYDKDIILKLEKTLDNALRIANIKSKDIKQISKEPSNKNVAQQMRFESRKRKKNVDPNRSLRKPTSAEKKQFLDEIENKLFITNTVNIDHNYFLKE